MKIKSDFNCDLSNKGRLKTWFQTTSYYKQTTPNTPPPSFPPPPTRGQATAEIHRKS